MSSKNYIHTGAGTALPVRPGDAPQHYSAATLQALGASLLFAGVTPAETTALLTCLGAQKKPLQKGEAALRAGDPLTAVGVVLSGTVDVVRENADGERSLLARLGTSEHFAEALCCAGVRESPVSVIAESDAEVMLLDFKKILTTCPHSCVHHSRLIENMLRLVANKNLELQSRMELLSHKTIRKKVLGYLARAARGRASFAIPLGREALADYLCVDRSALSRELMRLRDEGVIEYHKNEFTLF